MKCNRCKVDKDHTDFGIGKTRCKLCVSKYNAYYKANRDQEIERAKRRSRDKKNRPIINAQKRAAYRKNPVNALMWNIKSKAKKRGIEFKLTHSDIIIPDKCPMLGFKLEIGSGHAAYNSPSVDRIDSSLGYIPGNVHVISHRANTIKNDASSNELQAIAKYLEKLSLFKNLDKNLDYVI